MPRFGLEKYTRSPLIALGLLLTACGADELPSDASSNPSDLTLIASPAGGEFMYEVRVALFADSPVEIYYTVDGESPMSDSGTRYDEPLVLGDSTLLRFAAKFPDGRWSMSQQELYTPMEDLSEIKEAKRTLRISDSSIYFAAHTSDDLLVRTVSVHSVGLEAVTIARAYISADPNSGSFYNEGIFDVDREIEGPVALMPGEQIDFNVSYIPTETLSSAALTLETNDERVEGGRHIINLSGRVFDW